VVFGGDFGGAHPGVEQAVRRFSRERGLEVDVEREKWILHKPAGS
jgi:hypothetical protein